VERQTFKTFYNFELKFIYCKFYSFFVSRFFYFQASRSSLVASLDFSITESTTIPGKPESRNRIS
jgi:hypothetical protein